MIRERGREYGASTGRPRRCGWFDAFATRYAAEINGFTSVALTKLDVLDALDEIKVCTGYKLDGRVCDSLPAVSQDLRRIEPIYATLPGWKTSTVGTTEMSSLPANARRYVEFLSEQIGVEIGLVSTGPERSQTIIVHDSAHGRLARQTSPKSQMSRSQMPRVVRSQVPSRERLNAVASKYLTLLEIVITLDITTLTLDFLSGRMPFIR